MKKILSSISIVLFILFSTPQKISFIPNQVPTAIASAAERPLSITPSRIIIPSLRLLAPIEHVSTDKNGKMSVPSGKTNKVGWYKYGKRPGERGSAVLAAHVNAAFKNLSSIKIGDEILIEDTKGSEVRFIVSELTYFPIKELEADYLFNRNDLERLTLITCAGKRTFNDTAYSHRLVVSAIRAN